MLMLAYYFSYTHTNGIHYKLIVQEIFYLLTLMSYLGRFFRSRRNLLCICTGTTFRWSSTVRHDDRQPWNTDLHSTKRFWNVGASNLRTVPSTIN